MPVRLPLSLNALGLSLLLVGGSAAQSPPAPQSPLRWTDETPDAMIDDATARAISPLSKERSQLAALAAIASLADRGLAGHARAAFDAIASAPSVAADVRGDAALLGRSLAPDNATDSGADADAKLGVVDALAVLGPFRDNGGGLDAHDGPEAGGVSFADLRARYSWGSYDVTWRAVPRAFAAANGVPLDLFIYPRKESCTWIATNLAVASAGTFVIRLAASGQARLVFDGADIARDVAVHEGARFDRLAARVHAAAGPHILAAKVCSGALEDAGRVRLRVTNDAGAPPEGVTASSDLGSGAKPNGRTAKVVADHIDTPLARILRGDATDEEARLEVSIVRTLGGADDMRSPRAPGVLATLAGSTVDVDRLAMAAWIAPSGANRSAWLEKARAAPAADPRTRAFVARRLVERHLEAGLADWAMAALRGARIDRASDPDASLIATEVDLALGPEALRISGMRRLAAVAQAQPAAPSALLELLAEIATPLDSTLALTVRERLAARGHVGSTVVVAEQARGSAAVVSSARRAFAGGLGDADDALAAAQAVAGAGAHDDALGLYELLSRWAPNRAAVWAGLAHEAGAAPADPMRDSAIAASLRRARELDPADARFRAELSFRTRTPATGEPHDDEKYLAPLQTILARRGNLRATPPGGNAPTKNAPSLSDPSAKSSPSTPRDADHETDVADRELHWLRAVVMHADRRVSELVHYAREIVIAPRTEEELYEDIPAEGDLTEIVRARVHRAGGGIAFPVEEVSDNEKPRIRWPELATGDVVEVAFRSWTAGPVGGRGDPPFFRLDYAGSLSTHPVLYNEVNVESPVDRPIHIDVINGKADRWEEKDDNGKHIVRLVWDHPSNVADEPYAPPLSEVIPTVVLSTFKNWDAFRSWYAEAVRGFTEPDAEVRAIAEKLTAHKPSREAKLKAIFDFVADDIRYVNYVSGEWWLPNRPQQLLARREGDCDDKALLLITLLKTVGIEAQEVLVQTRLTGQPSVLRAKGAAIPLFDHGIAFLPGEKGGTYLDATSPQSRLGPLPSMDARAVALKMDGPAVIVELPSSSPEEHGIDATWTIALRSDGSADLQGQEQASGDDAFWMRTYLSEPGARASWVEEHLLGGWFSTVEIDKKVEFRGDLPRGAAVVGWRAQSGGIARHEGDELVVALGPSQTLASDLAPLVRRTVPVWLPPHVAPRRESRAIRVIAPAGWTFGPLPLGGDENGGAFGRAHFDATQDPHDAHAILVHRTVVFDRSSIGVDEYPRWRAWVQRVDALMRRSVRLVPTLVGAR